MLGLLVGLAVERPPAAASLSTLTSAGVSFGSSKDFISEAGRIFEEEGATETFWPNAQVMHTKTKQAVQSMRHIVVTPFKQHSRRYSGGGVGKQKI